MSPEMLKSKLDHAAEEAASVLAELKRQLPNVDWFATFHRLVYHAYMRRALNSD